MKGRPGVNLIRWINEWTVDKETFDVFTRAAKQFGGSQAANQRHAQLRRIRIPYCFMIIA